MTTNVWYHLAAVRGSNFIQLYVNGQLDSQTNVSFPQDYGTNALYFGTSGQPYWDRKLKGALDEVSLYNRALAAGEIAGIYAAGSAGKCRAPSSPLTPPPPFSCPSPYGGGHAEVAALTWRPGESNLRGPDRPRPGPSQQLDRANEPHTQRANECVA